MSADDRRAIKTLISEHVRAALDSKQPNPLVGRADFKRDLIGSFFMAQIPFKRPRGRSVFGAYIGYEGAPLD